jgi:hypothetical protein
MQASHRVPKLTRAAFCLIASTISTIDFDTLADRDRVVAEFSSALRSTNPRFDSQRFEDACQPDGGLRRSKVVRCA